MKRRELERDVPHRYGVCPRSSSDVGSDERFEMARCAHAIPANVTA
jgi:hypothetical protein